MLWLKFLTEAHCFIEFPCSSFSAEDQQFRMYLLLQLCKIQPVPDSVVDLFRHPDVQR